MYIYQPQQVNQSSPFYGVLHIFDVNDIDIR